MNEYAFAYWIDWHIKHSTNSQKLDTFYQFDMFEDELIYAFLTIFNSTKAVFNPWTATEEEAHEAMRQWVINGGKPNDLDHPWLKYSGAKQVKLLKKPIEENHPQAGTFIMDCINTIVTHGLTAPHWLAEAFNTRYNTVSLLETRNWSDPLAFGSPHPPKLNIDSYRDYIDSILPIREEIELLISENPKMPIDINLFEIVADRINTKEKHKEQVLTDYQAKWIKASTARDYYYKSIATFGKPDSVKKRGTIKKRSK